MTTEGRRRGRRPGVPNKPRDHALTYSIAEAARLSGASEATAYTSAKLYLAGDKGAMPAVRIGRLIRVPKAAFARWMGEPQKGPLV